MLNFNQEEIMCTHMITISGEKLDELGKLIDHKHNINFSTKFSIYEKVPSTGADISESNDSKNKIRQQAKDILDKIQSHQEEEESTPEWMEGFEDLIRSDYVLRKGDYLLLEDLSLEQKVFLQNSLETTTEFTFLEEDYNYAYFNNDGSFVGLIYGDPFVVKKITFNDLFIPKQ